jgi:ABC-2 type transport system permease protein
MLTPTAAPVSPLRVATAFLWRDFLIAASYKTAFVADLAGVLFKTITFRYIGAAFEGSVSGSLTYHQSYFAFLLIGIALTDFVHTSVDTFAVSVRDSQMTGTLEVVLLSPIRMAEMVVYSSLWPYVHTGIKFVAYVAFGWFLFDLPVAPGGIAPALVVVVLTVLCFAPLGIISAAIIVVFKRGAWFQTLISASGVLLGGVAYPSSVLPAWAQAVGNALPLTHAANAMRGVLLNGQSFVQVGGDLTFMVVFALVTIPLSLWMFQLSVGRAKQLGTLTQY